MTHKSNIRFEKLLLELLALDKSKLIESSIADCYLPSPTLNALFLLRHTGEHFAANEITLRHVFDLGFFFKRYHNEIDWDRVLSVYASERMKQFYDAIATICDKYLGFDDTCFNEYNSSEVLAAMIIEDIFKEKDLLLYN